MPSTGLELEKAFQVRSRARTALQRAFVSGIHLRSAEILDQHQIGLFLHL